MPKPRPIRALVLLVLGLAVLNGCGEDPDTGKAAGDSAKTATGAESDPFERLVTEALELRRAGRPLEARARFEEAARLRPDDPRVVRGLRLQRVGPERAAAALDRLEAAEDALFLGHQLDALHELAEARQLDPNDERIEALYAGACLKTRRFHEAFALFDEIVRSDPARTDAYLGRAEAAYRAQDWDRAVASLDDLDRRATAPAPDREFADRLPQLRFLLGVALYNLYRYPEAKVVLEKAVAAQPTTPQFREFLANSLLEGGEFERAAQEFQTLIDLAPTTRLARYKRGKAFDRLGRKEEAIAAYRAELALDPKEFQVAIECARCYEALGGEENLRAARPLLLDAIERNPLSHDARFSLQSVERKLGLKEEAELSNRRYQELIAFKDARESELRVFERRRKNDPNDTEAWLAQIAIKARYSQVEEVIEIVRKFVNAQPRNVEGLFHLAQLFLVLRENEDAWHEAAKMIDYAPEDARGYAIGATALIRLSRHREALPLARRALVLDDTNGDALEALWTALQRLEPDSAELEALRPLHDRMLEEQRRQDEEMKKLRDPLDIFGR